MDTKTGKIVEISDIEYKDTESLLRQRLTALSQKEHETVYKLEEHDRPLELALMRFVEERKRLGASYSVEIKNAFKQGYLAATKDRS